MYVSQQNFQTVSRQPQNRKILILLVMFDI